MIAAGNVDEKLKALSLNRVFASCDASTLQSAARECAWQTYAAEQTLFMQDDECNSLLIVAMGSVSMSLVAENGRELILAEAKPGDLIGDIELVLGCQRLTSGMASGTVAVLSLRRTAFNKLLESQAFSTALLQAVCVRCWKLSRLTERMALSRLEQRLASLLLDLCREHGRKVDEGMLIDHKISQTRMAQLINASRPKVNVQLHTWQTGRLIRLERKRIMIRDRLALKRIAAATIRQCDIR